jgi:hypothetical protein
MSTIKNFGQAGVGSDVQYGKAGPRLITSGGVFSFKAANAVSFANIEVATPLTNDHATPRLYVDTVDTAIKTGAGLLSNGVYQANSSGNYINAATSLKSADNLLDTALYNVSVLLTTTKTSAGLAADGTLPTWSGTNYITNTTSLYNAVKALDTAVANATTAITNIGSAFNYVGTLSGGANTTFAYDLSTLPTGGKDTGDYYKVAAAGYFKDNAAATPFFANLSDGLVKNSTVSSWDKIDNTNSTITGTSNRLSITGSPDTGYTADIDAAYVGQTSLTTVGTIATGTWNANTISVAKGGTGLVSYTSGDILYATGSTTLAKLAKGTGLQYLRINSGATAPEYATLVATDVNFSSGNYSATNVGGALDEIKTQLGALASNAIVSPDTKTGITASDTNGLQFYDEMATTKTEFLRLQGNATTAAFAAQGTGSNINLTLIPKGTGNVNVSNAVLTGLANASSNTDALPLVQAKALFTRYLVVDITEANANVTIGSVNGVVLRVIVYLSVAFASGSTLSIGYSGSQSALAAVGDIDHTNTGVNVIDNITVLNQNILAYITGTGSGAGKVIIEYLAS